MRYRLHQSKGRISSIHTHFCSAKAIKLLFKSHIEKQALSGTSGHLMAGIKKRKLCVIFVGHQISTRWIQSHASTPQLANILRSADHARHAPRLLIVSHTA
jgi:hypothetical protein